MRRWPGLRRNARHAGGNNHRKDGPERLFSFRWHPYAIEKGVDYSAEPTSLIEFVLEEIKDGVMLTVTESGFDQIPVERRVKAFTANEQGWGMVLKLIEEYFVRKQ